MLTEISERMGYANIGHGEYEGSNGLVVKFSDKSATITEKLEIEDDGNKITALTYASGKLNDAKMATDGTSYYFVPNDLGMYHLRIAMVHYCAPEAVVIRPIKIIRIQYEDGMLSPEDLLEFKIKELAESRFKKPEVKYLGNSGNVYIYLATSMDFECKGEPSELLAEMLGREPKNEVEAVIIEELRKTFRESCPQQVYSTLLHEENHPAHPHDEYTASSEACPSTQFSPP